MGKLTELLLGTVLAATTRGKMEKDLWLFSSNENVHFDSNARYLFLYVKENCPHLRPRFVMNDPLLREELSKTYGEEYFLETVSLEGKKMALKAGAWFTSAGLPLYGIGLGKGRVVINLWHGLPLKRIALADPNTPKATRLLFPWVFSKNYTWVVTSSKVFVPIMAEAFGVRQEQVAIWGQPRCDGLVKGRREERERTEEKERAEERERTQEREKTEEKERAEEKERTGERERTKEKERTEERERTEEKERAEEKIKEREKREEKGKKNDYKVLYAPTFRDGKDTWLFPFLDYDKERLDTWLSAHGITIYLRLHHLDQTDSSPVLSSRVQVLGTEQVEDVTESLPMFDALVTDYSSIYIDYLLVDKGMIFLPYDQEEYLSGRGMYFPYEEVTPGAKPKTMEDFLLSLEKILEGRDAYAMERKRVKDFFHEVQKPCCQSMTEEVERELGIR